MIDLSGSTFRFAHDKIQEAAYGSMPDRQRHENHMRFGLALCTQALQNSVEDDKLFFTAMNQINEAGLSALHDISQKHVIAELNLKAGRRATDLSDYNTALKLFQYGISFLGGDCWTADYKLSIEL